MSFFFVISLWTLEQQIPDLGDDVLFNRVATPILKDAMMNFESETGAKKFLVVERERPF